MTEAQMERPRRVSRSVSTSEADRRRPRSKSKSRRSGRQISTRSSGTTASASTDPFNTTSTSKGKGHSRRGTRTIGGGRSSNGEARKRGKSPLRNVINPSASSTSLASVSSSPLHCGEPPRASTSSLPISKSQNNMMTPLRNKQSRHTNERPTSASNISIDSHIALNLITKNIRNIRRDQDGHLIKGFDTRGFDDLDIESKAYAKTVASAGTDKTSLMSSLAPSVDSKSPRQKPPMKGRKPTASSDAIQRQSRRGHARSNSNDGFSEHRSSHRSSRAPCTSAHRRTARVNELAQSTSSSSLSKRGSSSHRPRRSNTRSPSLRQRRTMSKSSHRPPTNKNASWDNKARDTSKEILHMLDDLQDKPSKQRRNNGMEAQQQLRNEDDADSDIDDDLGSLPQFIGDIHSDDDVSSIGYGSIVANVRKQELAKSKHQRPRSEKAPRQQEQTDNQDNLRETVLEVLNLLLISKSDHQKQQAPDEGDDDIDDDIEPQRRSRRERSHSKRRSKSKSRRRTESQHRRTESQHRRSSMGHRPKSKSRRGRRASVNVATFSDSSFDFDTEWNNTVLSPTTAQQRMQVDRALDMSKHTGKPPRIFKENSILNFEPEAWGK